MHAPRVMVVFGFWAGTGALNLCFSVPGKLSSARFSRCRTDQKVLSQLARCLPTPNIGVGERSMLSRVHLSER